MGGKRGFLPFSGQESCPDGGRSGSGGRGARLTGAEGLCYPSDRKLSGNSRLVIATDLDGTFLGGSSGCREGLYKWIESQRQRVVLVFVTGRGLGSVTELVDDPAVPNPDYVIADVGATVARGPELVRLEDLEARLRGGWPGDDEVRARFSGIDGLEPQDVPMSGRVSFYRRKPEAELEAQALADQMGLCVLVSKEGLYLDILPPGATKGAALLALLRRLELEPERCLVCGDTLNDLSLFRTGLPGVVVGESEAALVEATRGVSTVLQSERAGAGGIADALAHFFRESVQ